MSMKRIWCKKRREGENRKIREGKKRGEIKVLAERRGGRVTGARNSRSSCLWAIEGRGADWRQGGRSVPGIACCPRDVNEHLSIHHPNVSTASLMECGAG